MTEQGDHISLKRTLRHRPLLWIGLAVAAMLLVAIGMIRMGAWYAAASSFQYPLPTSGLLAVITNSGSTNMPASTLTLNTDGSGSLVYQKDTNAYLGGNTKRFVNKTFPAGTFDIAQLKNILTQIKDVSAIPNHECLKSISFGSTTTIGYMGKTSGDVSCLSNADQNMYLDVKEQVQTLYMQALKS